jgi:hypothetical protein
MNTSEGNKALDDSKIQSEKKDSEIINIDKAQKSEQNKASQNKKDCTDNASSESTTITPNKIRNKKEKETTNIKSTEAISKTETKVEKKVLGKKGRKNQSKKIDNEEEKDKKNLRIKQLESITLEESDSDDDIQIISEVKAPRGKRKKKHSPKMKNKVKGKKVNEEEIIKSKSTIKSNRKSNKNKDNRDNILGLKRKESNKSADKSTNPNKKEKVSNQNGKKGCLKLNELNQLFIENGFEKVIDTLYKSKLGEKYKKEIDSCLKDTKSSLRKEKLPFLLMKILYSYFSSQIEEIKEECLKRPTSAKKIAAINFEAPEKEKSVSKTPEKSLKCAKGSSNSTIEVGESGSEFDNKEVKEVSEVNKTVKEVKETKTQIKDKINNDLSVPYYNKTNDEEIYKYQFSKSDEKGNVLFNCYDKKCKGVGIFDVDSKKFSVAENHNIEYISHDYVANDCNIVNVIKDLKESKYTSSQIFKENGEIFVKMP